MLKGCSTTVALWLLAALALNACDWFVGADFDGLHLRDAAPALVYCDARLSEDSCALIEGRPMTCFGAGQLGGKDYCVEQCNPVEGPEDPERFVCLASGALFERCDPAVRGECPGGLRCFRTDIGAFENFYPPQSKGLCMAVPVCNDRSDCHGDRNVCGGEALRESYQDPLFDFAIKSDHLQCVQACDAPGSCPGSQYCLTELTNLKVPAICMPSCDQQPCPPGSYCQAKGGPGYPPTCLPGLPGFRCDGAEDCLLGYCVDTGAGFNVCSADCETDSDCNVLSRLQFRMLCLEGHCANKQSYSGAICTGAGDGADVGCPDDEHCSDYDPYVPARPRPANNLECRRSCDGEGRCRPVGGMPQVCLPNGECYPGDLGLECKENEECMSPFSCECLENCDTPETAIKICSTRCTTDDECLSYEHPDPELCDRGLCLLRPL